MKKVYIILYVILFIALSSFAYADLEDNLLHAYDFEETSGNLLDKEGTADSTADSITDKNAAGINNNAWDFELDSADEITLTDDHFVYGNFDRSFFTWIKPESFGGLNRVILFYGSTSTTNYFIKFMIEPAGNYLSLDSNNDVVTGTKALGTGGWQLVGFTFDTTNDNLTLWVNNTNVGSDIQTLNTQVGAEVSLGVYSNEQFYDGVMDETYYWNKSLVQSDIDDLFNSGAGYFYPYAGVPGAPSTPTIVSPSPADNSHNNTNVTLNVTHSTPSNDVRYYLYFGDSTPLNEGDYQLFNATRDGAEWKNFTTNVSDGTYYWKWKIQNITDGKFSGNTTERTLIIDTNNPTITLNTPNNFSSTNTTILSPLIHNLSIDLTFFDTYLYQTLLNITNSTSKSVYSALNTTIGGKNSVNLSRTIDISGWAIGEYTIKAIATDSHTAKEINRYGVINGLNYFRYTTDEGNIIVIKSNTIPLSKSTTKLKDRYDFEFNYLLQQDTYTYTIESYNKIEYIQNSDFQAHFVIITNDGRGNWIDFENPLLSKKDYAVTKIDDYTYRVEIEANGIKNFRFSSLGGLNKVEKHYKLQLGSVINITATDINTGKWINATFTIGGQSSTSIENITSARLVNITRDTTQIIINATGYGTEIQPISLTEKYHNLSFSLTPVSTAKVYFYDEKSETLIAGETFSVYLETTGFSETYSAATNPYIISSLDSGLYNLKVSSGNYPERQRFNINVSNTTTTNINLYMVNTTYGAEKTFSVTDLTGINPLQDVFIVFSRVINGTQTKIAEEYTDYAGRIRLYLDEDYQYRINFSKAGYKVLTINLEPIDDNYPIVLESETETITNHSLGIYYKFSPIDSVLQNNTKYNFTFQINSSDWSLTNCTLRLKNGTKVLSESSVYTLPSCFLRIEYDTGTMKNITSEAIYEINSAYTTVLSKEYSIIHSYKGQFSFKNFLDDLTDFGMAGFDSFGRIIIALIIIFVITALAAQNLGFTNAESLLPLIWGLVGFFSYIGWFYLDNKSIPDITGLRKYIIFILVTLIGLAFFIDKFAR